MTMQWYPLAIQKRMISSAATVWKTSAQVDPRYVVEGFSGFGRNVLKSITSIPYLAPVGEDGFPC
jgi:hypothetical protein